MDEPNEPDVVYVQLATFAAVVIAIVPLTRAKAVRLEREIGELERLEVEQN